MKKCIALALSCLLISSPAMPDEARKPKEELKCDPNNLDEYKEVEYYVNGKLHVEYCAMGKKHILIDHGNNG